LKSVCGEVERTDWQVSEPSPDSAKAHLRGLGRAADGIREYPDIDQRPLGDPGRIVPNATARITCPSREISCVCRLVQNSGLALMRPQRT
jgi:hypothetical protein